MFRIKKFAPLFIYFLISMLTGSGQANNKYDAAWKKVQGFMAKQLPKSALTEVNKIYALARKEKQDAQLIKSLIYISDLQEQTREDNQLLSIKEWEKEAQTLTEPSLSILNNLIARKYQFYFQQHRWELYQRSATINFNKDDIATWSTDDFHKKITWHYLQSIKNEKLLQQTGLQQYEPIIQKGNMRHLRPTLYDLLTHHALEYFKNDESGLKKPAYAFEINQASAFDPAADFTRHKFPTADSLSLQHKALLLFQKLIAFHLNDAKHDALIDVDLERINFVYQESVHPEKDKLYLNALNHIANQYDQLPAATQAWYLMAQFHENKAATYKPYGDSTYRLSRVKAKEICEKIISQKDSSEGKINCINLLNNIKYPSIEFEIEKVNVPAQPFRALVNYRNVEKVYLRIVKADEKTKKLFDDRYTDNYWNAILALKAEKNWEQSLPQPGDYQSHSVEIPITGLPYGEYLLLAANDKEFTNKKTLIGARVFYVSNISFINNEKDFFILDRDKGTPLAKAAVDMYIQQYDYAQSRTTKVKSASYTTDANGFFRLKDTKPANKNEYRNNSYLLDINYQGEHLFMNDWISDYYFYRDLSDNGKPEETIRKVFLFTDRGLYRPGQTVFYKGIVIEKKPGTKSNTIAPNFPGRVYLKNSNDQMVDSIDFVTGEYGSFSGKFQLPASGLTGSFSIVIKKMEGYAGFNVEEYKRPKFFVDFETIKGTYKVNDKIKVTGFAKAYAGNNIDGAKVTYRVVRQPRFPYPWVFWRWWQPPTQQMEILHGETVTDREGKFIVEFTAIPDLSIDKKFEPVFDYRVYADVLDINGETRSSDKEFSVGYKSLILETSNPQRLPVDSLKKLIIRTRNMNGEYEITNVQVKIIGLKEESRLIRPRYWKRPDQFIMTKDEYIKLFPFDEYDNETDTNKWPQEAIIFEKTDSTRISGEWPLNLSKPAPGSYAIEIVTKDKYGEIIKDVNYIEIYDEKAAKLQSPQYLWTINSTPIEPGETTTIQIGTAADNLFVIQEKRTAADEPGKGNYSFLKLDREKKQFPFSATEADRGGYGTGWVFVKHNRYYQFKETIQVPWTNKELKIEYASFRDKTLPGSEEKWKIKITGYKKEKLAAEMLAGMYDASLDQFYSFNWSLPTVHQNFWNTGSWQDQSNFEKIESEERPVTSYITFKNVFKQYDWLSGGMVAGWESALFGKVSGVAVGGQSTQIRIRGVAYKEVSFEHDSAAPPTAEKNQTEQINPSTVKTHIDGITARKNFNETAFFFPDLKTDAEGNIEFSFKMPEALTKWKFQAIAHTKELAFGFNNMNVITQKELMVQPNPPRFLREGDKMEFTAKLVNLSDKELTGQAQLELFDAVTNESVDGWFINSFPNQYFTVAAGQSEAIKFPIQVPFLFDKALTWRIVAKAGNYSDGEENAMAVLTNRMLVTESLPIHVRGNAVKSLKLDKLINSEKSETIKHHSLTVEYSANPVWYAVQSLPYLMEYPYDCAEQVWNRYYANALATKVTNSFPSIKTVFEKWKLNKEDAGALLSNLRKNQELKSVLLEETPWVLQAASEEEQKKNIALLFDLVKMSNELGSSIEKIRQMQTPNGGFAWFAGGPDDQHITQYILTGIGHLRKLKAGNDDRLDQIIKKALPYLDRKIKQEYDDLIKSKANLKTIHPSGNAVFYLYMRSFFPENKIPTASLTAYNLFRERAAKTWTTENKYIQGLIAIMLGRTGDSKTAMAILKSLKETAIYNEELGMYWKDLRTGWHWYEAPIERQALMIEVFQEIGNDLKTVDELRTWLLKNKQTNHWPTTKSTAEAVYALLLNGSNWVNNTPTVEIRLGKEIVKESPGSAEAGTGYIKKTIEGKKVNPEMGKVTVAVNGLPNASSSTWGAVYWQYFEDLDKITTSSTPLQLVKKLFIEKNTDRGPVLSPIAENGIVKVGDKIKVRIELRVDRDMDYVHMKDMRASGLEPVNVISGYKWQGRLGYYESTRDASTNFFFNSLPKGTYVFEYSLFVTHAGNFSNGITSIQCMYAPEFSSHSEGIRINVE